MWNAKCLVQVQMRHVSAHNEWIRHTDLSLQICTVKVHLTTKLVYNVNGLLNFGKVDTCGAGLRDHAGCQYILVGLCLRTQIIEINGTIWKRLDRHYFHSSHHS